MVVQRLALLPCSKKVLGLNLSADWGLFTQHLHVLPFLPQPKDMHSF